MPGPLSALVGERPLTADDTLIVHGWQVLFRMGKAEPSKGLRVAIKPPPSGVPHDSTTAGIAAGAAVSMVLMLLFTGTRLVVRATNRNLTFGWDDWVIILACLLALLTPILAVYKVVNAGAGKHVYDVTYWELANHQSISTPSFLLFYVALAFIKISIVLFYMRLTAFTSRAWRTSHQLFVAFLLICALVSLLVTVFQCNPPIYSNIREIARGDHAPKCMPILDLVIGFNVWHILSDCLLLVVPFMMLWKVQMAWSTKLKVCGAGLVGFANVGLALARTIVQATEPQRGFDLTYTATTSFRWSVTELTLGIMTANLPVLSAVVTKAAKKLSWASLSDDASPYRSPDRGGRRSRATKPSSSSKNLVKEGHPTVRHDVEYGPKEESMEEVVEMHETTKPENY